MACKGVILISGGAGFIGSHCAVVLLEQGYDVVVMDNGANIHWGKNKSKPESMCRVEKITGKCVEFVKGDLLNEDDLSNLFAKYNVSCVIHCAALKAVKESVERPLSYYMNNITGSVNLFRVMTKFGVKSLIFSSSSTVYGDPQFLPLTENHPTGQNCANPYGKTKFMVEEILKDLVISDKQWRVYSLRYFNPVGAHPSGEIGEDPAGIPNNLMPIVVQVASGKRKVLGVFGNDYKTVDGTGVRDYIHIMDLAEGHTAAVDKLLSEGSGVFKAYNLGTGSGYSVLEIVNAFERVNKVKVPYKFESRRAGDVASSYCSADMAAKELGWKARYAIDEMCRDSWNWHIKNPNGYQ